MTPVEVGHRASRACAGRQVSTCEPSGRGHGERIECALIMVSVCWRDRVIPVRACSRMGTRGYKCNLCSGPQSTGTRTAQACQLLVIQKEATRRSWANGAQQELEGWRVSARCISDGHLHVLLYLLSRTGESTRGIPTEAKHTRAAALSMHEV